MTPSRRSFIAFAVAAAVLLGPAVLAQGRQGQPQNGRIYNPGTETTLTGTVDAVETITQPRGGRGLGGLHLTLNTGTDSIEVHLGPVAFLNEKNITIDKGDMLKVLGSRVTLDGRKVLIAREITKGDRTVTLRDESGRPLWAGGPGRGR